MSVRTDQFIGFAHARVARLAAYATLLEEFMNAELLKMDVPVKFLVVGPVESARTHAEMDAQLFEAFLGIK